MGIDVYATWSTQTEEQRDAQLNVWMQAWKGHLGYLREAYHGEPYATRFLCAEAFEKGEGAPIPCKVLKARLPRALALAEMRERTIYHSRPAAIERTKQSYRDFVALCEAKENETGEPVFISADW